MRLFGGSTCRFAVSTAMALLSLAFLSGCVDHLTVESEVKGNGTVIRTVRFESPTNRAEVALKGAQKLLGKDWRTEDRAEGARHLVSLTRKFSTRDSQKPFPAAKLTVTTRLFVPFADLSYSEELKPTASLVNDVEKQAAALIKVRYRFIVPGKLVVAEPKPLSADYEAGLLGSHTTVEWETTLADALTVNVKTRACRRLLGLVELLLLLVIYARVLVPIGRFFRSATAGDPAKARERAERKRAAAEAKAAARAEKAAAKAEKEKAREQPQVAELAEPAEPLPADEHPVGEVVPAPEVEPPTAPGEEETPAAEEETPRPSELAPEAEAAAPSEAEPAEVRRPSRFARFRLRGRGE